MLDDINKISDSIGPFKINKKSRDDSSCPCRICKIFIDNLALSNVFLLFVFCFEKSLIPNVPEWSMALCFKMVETHLKNLVASTTKFSKCVSL